MRRLLFLVSGVVFVETIFFTVITPLLPEYERTIGLSKFEAGVLVGSYAAGSFIASLPGWLLASRFGVKVTVLAGLIFLAGLSIVFGLAGSFWLLNLARFGQGIGAALCWTGGLAWLVTHTPGERRGELIGLVTAAAAAGALLGPAVGAAATIVGVPATFVALAVPALALGFWTMRVPGPRPRGGLTLRSVLPAISGGGLAIGVWLIALPSLMFGVLGVIAPLQLGHLGLPGSLIGAIFLLAAAGEAGASVVVGRWADRSGRGTPLRASLQGAVAVSLVLPIAAATLWSLAILVVLAGTIYGAFFAPAIALLADEMDAAGLEQVFGFALLNIAWAPAYLVGSAGGGAIAALIGEAAPYLILALLCTLTLNTTKRLAPDTWRD